MKKKLIPLQLLIVMLIPTLLLAQAKEPSAIEKVLKPVVDTIFGVLFATPLSFIGFDLPLLLIILAGGGVFFTFRYGFLNVKLFRHAIDVVRGKYDNPNDKGEITHFQALTSALSATVGLGNIAGVAVAIAVGGPGAVFWMWVVAFFGMSMKFSSCTLAQVHRKVYSDGHVLGGPMVYLQEGLKNIMGYPVAKTFAVVFAIFTILGSLGGGNLFQSNQTYELVSEYIAPGLKGTTGQWIVGAVISVMVGAVIIGGIKRIGEVTSKIVPFMCIFYVIICAIIVFGHATHIPELITSIFKSAFAPDAAFGGFMGVLIQGVKRASFSNESGLGSAAIAHAAAKTDEPVREGTVAMIGPFIDTHVVCTMTALAILITGAHTDPALAGKGAAITAKAFGSLGTIFPKLLTIAVIIFAYSTIISWSYYGERATEYLFGRSPIAIAGYRILYVFVTLIGPALSLSVIIDFSDAAILSMAIPNIIGMIFLSGHVKGMVDSYLTRLNAGEMKTYK